MQCLTKYNLLLSAILIVIPAIGCGGGGSMPDPTGNNQAGTTMTTGDALAEIEGIEKPDDVTAEVFEQYRAALTSELTTQAGRTYIQGPPEQSSDAVRHIAPIASNSEVIRLVWRERLGGDFNHDGVVDARDLSMLARRHDARQDDGRDDALDSTCDSNEDGMVSTTDVKPIASNYQRRLEGYTVFRYTYESAEEPEAIGKVARSDATPVYGSGLIYAFNDQEVETDENYVYFVRPYYRDGLGIRSQEVMVTCGSSYGMSGPGTTPILVSTENGDVYAHPNELIVHFSERPTQAQLFEKVYGELAGFLVGRITKQEAYRVHIPPCGMSIKSLMKRYADNPDPVMQIEFDHLMDFETVTTSKSASKTYGDPGLSSQWALDCIGAEQAWDFSEGHNVTIGIIDTGLLDTHTDLQSKWTGMHRVNATNDEINNGDVFTDFDGHGTVISGVAAMEAGNGWGGCGLAAWSSIYMIKAGRYYWINNEWDWRTLNSEVAEAIGVAMDHDCSVINMSLSSTAGSLGLSNACSDALFDDHILVAAAGNQNTDVRHYPAAYYEVVSVGGMNESEDRWVVDADAGSNYGWWVDICAPAEDVYSTSLDGGWDDFYDGTSLASPYVAAAAALVRSYNPGLDRQQVMDWIFDNAQPISTDEDIGDRLDIGETLAANTTQEIVVTCDDPVFITCEPGHSGYYDFTIANTGGDDLSYSIQSPFGWVVFTPGSGVIAGGGQQTVELAYEMPNTDMNFSGDFVIMSNDYDEPEISIEFMLASIMPEIELTPLSIDIEVEAGESATEHVLIENVGEAVLDFYAEGNGTYLEGNAGTELIQLHVDPGQSYSFGITANTSNIIQTGNIAGTYPGTVTLYTNDSDESMVVIDVNIIVSDTSTWPQISVDTSTIYLSLQPGGVSTFTLPIESTGTDDLMWDVQTTGPILGCQIHTGMLPPGQTEYVQIDATAPVSRGSYSEDFRIMTNVLMGPVYTITVELNVFESQD